ncbi:ankyrin unc44 [Colletotrichum incanum]|uniref:Ankyrin unc44 n=1 Tax=Colletotrichum incanum TaxID=1573173 RepID=A0A161YC96_COLIC|nr:ankyrin unc44 [Colletotrichum incanum]OHW98817.1 ankyrin unc44 [Colletotrichum incanum]
MAAGQCLRRSLTEVQAKTELTYRSIRYPGNHHEIRSALRIISGTLHSLSLMFEDFADTDHDATSACPEYSLFEALSNALDDLNLALSRACESSESGNETIPTLEIISQIRQIQGQLDPAVHAKSWAALLVCLSTTGLRKSLRKQKLDQTNGSSSETSDIAPDECLTLLLNTDFDHKLDNCYSHLIRVAERDVTHPEYAACAKLLPDIARSHHHSVAKELRLLFHPRKSANFLQWLLEYARQEWPDHFNPKLGALSMSPLLRLMSTVSDASVSTLHIAAALGLPHLCKDLILLEKQDVDQQSSLGTPLYCALLGPAALFARSDDPAQLIADLRLSSCQELTLDVLLDAGASCTVSSAGPQQDEEFSLATLAFLTCQSIHAPKIMVRILRSSVSLDRRFVQLFHGKDSLLQYWPSSLPPPTHEFLASVLVEILDLAVPQYDSYNDKSLLATGIYDILDRFGLAEFFSGRGSRPLDVSDMKYTDLVREAIQDCEIAVIRRLILDPRWDPNASMDRPARRRSVSSSDSDSASPKPRKTYTILHYAVEADEADLVSLILDSGEEVDVHVRNQHEQTPLMLSESPEILRILLDFGARTTDTDEDGRNIWHFAAANSDIDLIDVLHKHDKYKDQNLKGLMKDGQTPIAQSVIYPLKMMKRHRNSNLKDPVGALHMLEVCAPNVAYLQSPTPLIFLAVEWGSDELVRKLIAFGADPLIVDDDGRNVLHHLNAGAREPLVETLLELQVKPLMTTDGLSPAETIFSAFNDSEFCDRDPDQPFNHPANSRPLDIAAYTHLLTNEILNSRNNEGAGLWERFAVTVLGTWAFKWPSGFNAWVSLQNAFQCLIKKKALVKYEEEKDECGLIPLLSGWAKKTSNHERYPRCLEEILSSILQASTKTESFKESPTAVQCLKLAVQQEHTYLVAKLLELGVSVHARCENVSVLESACMPHSTCQPAMFDKLIEHADSSKLNDVNSFGIGLLFRLLDHRVLHHRHKLSTIVRKGCDPNTKTPSGVPMVVAYIEERQTESALVLLEAGADPAALSKSGLDAALAAASRGDLLVLNKIKSIRSSFDWNKSCTYDFCRMDTGGDPGITTKRGCNALHLAASNSYADVLRFYFTISDLDVESQTADGWRPIHFAAAYHGGDGSCVRVLLEHGADPTATLPSRKHWNPLTLALVSGCEAVRPLLNLGSEVVSRMNVPTAFVAAIQSGNRELTELFRPFINEMVIKPDGKKGQTSVVGAVLELCIEENDEDLATRALKMVDPETLNSIRMSCGKCSPIVLAAARGQFTLGKLFLNFGMTTWNLVDRCLRHFIISLDLHYPCTALHIALMRPSHLPSPDMKEFVMSLLSAIDWTRHELSPLHCAASSGVPDRVRTIIDWIRGSPEHHSRLLHGVQAWSLSTPIDNAESCDPSSGFLGKSNAVAPESTVHAIVRYYVNKRVASPDLRPMFHLGRTPLLIAVDETNVEMMEVLLESGADVNMPDLDVFDTPLHEAARASCLDGASLLLNHGANPNLRNSRSFTPLTLAVEQGHLEMAELLVEHGADIHVCDADGMSLLNTCGEESRDPEMFIWLMSLGLDPYRLDKAGYTPIHDVILNNAFPNLTFNHGFDFSRVRDIRKGFLSLVIEFNHKKANDILLRLLKRLPRANAVELVNSTPEAFVSPLCNAVIRDELDSIPTLLRHGADINAEGSAEGSALMVACVKRRLKAVKILVRHGASISYQTTIDGVPVFRSALEYAKPFPYIVRWLLVDRYTRLRSIESASETTGQAMITPWSGGQVVGYELSGIGINTGRRSGETGLEYLRRLDVIRWSLRGQTVRVVTLE